MSNTTTAVAVPSTKGDIRDFLQSDTVKDQIALALPKHMSPDRMARVACTAILKTPKLLDCKKESLLSALMLCSQAGLEPDGRNAHLIPYGDTVQVIFDYKGLVALAERNGVECIYADKVCENDEFKAWVEDGEKKLTHNVDWRKPRGKAFAYYSSCRRNGRLDYEVMPLDEVEAIRKRSRAGNSGPWVTDFDEMGKKTVLRRHSKRWDICPELASALQNDFDNIDNMKRAAVIEPVAFVAKTEPKASLPEPSNEVVGASPIDAVVLIVEQNNASFDNFKRWAVSTNFWPTAKDWKAYGDVPADVAAKIAENPSGLRTFLQGLA